MITEAVRRFCALHHIGPEPVVIAVSGGIDSTALLLASRDAGLDVIAAHVNHHLRGAESDEDETFVRDLCKRLGVPLHVADGSLDPGAVRDRGVEAAARETRYARLEEIRRLVNARWIATAHQRNDQAETVLMRLITGSGLAGLRGIHPVRDDRVIRPLLDVGREEIEADLTARGITARLDRSNADPRFLRNRLRAMLRDLDPAAVHNLAAIADQARDRWPAIEREIDEADRDCVDARDDETRFVRWPEEPWLRASLLHRHIRRLDPHARDVSADDLARLAAEVDAIRRVSVTKSLELVRRDGILVLRRPPTPTAEFEVALTPGTPAFIPTLGLTMHLARANEQRSTNNEQRIQLPPGVPAEFTVRNRRRGDRFQPLGFPHEKKLKDFLIDRKIAAEVRDSIPLLIHDGAIVWVAGVEVSDRYKVTSPSGELFDVWMEGR